ncbi:MAG: S-layer homology domain-containing protein [Clostridia bacterium]|nr:S-layer homology domain-containing protein [Clostridia bacterium]
MKKIISILLCTIMMFSSFSVVMAADVIESEANVNADLAAMQAIGVFDSNLVSGAAMTRRQLADVFFSILLPDQADDEYIPTKVYFDDILESDFAINVIHEAGIMNGMGDNKFMPDNNVTYIQVVKSIIDFLGYKLHAEAYGGYPAGYVVMASKFELDDYAPSDMNMICTTDMAAVLFRQALDIPVNQYIFEKENGDGHYELNDTNYLGLYTKVYFGEGIITATYVEDTYQFSDTGYFDIRINNIPVTLSDAVLSMNELLGYKVTYFYNLDEHNNKVVLHYEVADTEIMEFDRNNLDGTRTTTERIGYFNEKGKPKKIDISKAYIFYNGNLTTSYDATVINPFSSGAIDGYIRTVSTDRDADTAEYVFIEAFKSYVVKNVQGNDIINKYHPDVIFKIDDIQSGEVVVKNVLGEVIDPASITEYDILNVFAERGNDVKPSKIIISLDSYVGKIEKYRQTGTQISHITIDGQEFEIAANLYNNKEFADIELGAKVKIMFNHLGQISDIGVSDYDTTVFGYIIDAAKLTPMLDTVSIKMLTAKNTIEFIELAENVILDDVKRTDDYVFANLGVPVTRQLCQYKLNADGNKIISITTVNAASVVDPNADAVLSADGLRKMPAIDGFFYRGNSLSGNGLGYALVSGSTLVFAVPENEADRDNNDLYMVTDSSIFTDENDDLFPGKFTGYATKAYSPTIEAAVFKVNDLKTTVYKPGATPFVVTDTSRQLIDDEIVCTITGYSGTTLYTYEITEEAFQQGEGGTAIEIGDVIKVARDNEGVVVLVEPIFRASDWKLTSTMTNPSETSYSAGWRYASGEIYWMDGYGMIVEIPTADPSNPLREPYAHGNFKIFEYSVDNRGKKTIEYSNSSSMRDNLNNGQPSKVLICVKSSTPQIMIVSNE